MCRLGLHSAMDLNTSPYPPPHSLAPLSLYDQPLPLPRSHYLPRSIANSNCLSQSLSNSLLRSRSLALANTDQPQSRSPFSCSSSSIPPSFSAFLSFFFSFSSFSSSLLSSFHPFSPSSPSPSSSPYSSTSPVHLSFYYRLVTSYLHGV